jgi:hypothetical protein
MSGDSKVDAVTGVVTVAVAGISGAFTIGDAQQWGDLLITLFPYVLIIFLIWRIHKLAAQHQDCVKMHDQLQDQIIYSMKRIDELGDK